MSSKPEARPPYLDVDVDSAMHARAIEQCDRLVEALRAGGWDFVAELAAFGILVEAGLA